jgi:hypothetical protein
MSGKRQYARAMAARWAAAWPTSPFRRFPIRLTPEGLLALVRWVRNGSISHNRRQGRMIAM